MSCVKWRRSTDAIRNGGAPDTRVTPDDEKPWGRAPSPTPGPKKPGVEAAAALADDVQGEAPAAGEDVVREVAPVDGRHQERRVARHLRHPRRRHAVAAVAIAHREHIDACGERGERAGERGLHAPALAP